MLNIGDKIIRYSNYGVIDCLVIEKVTPTQAIITLTDSVIHRTVKLKREPNQSGIISEISPDKFSVNRYRLPQNNDIEEANFKTAIRICCKCDFNRLDKKKVVEIASIISSYQA